VLVRYPVVLLDVGETMVGPRESFGAVYARVLSPLGLDLDAGTLEKALRTAWKELDEAVPRGRDRYSHFPGGEDGYWIRFVRDTIRFATGAPVPGRFAERALGPLREAFLRADAWQVYPDVVPALRALRSMGVRMGVVSNWDSRLPVILEILRLRPYFETVAVSHFEGVEKPDPALFHAALDRMNAPPGEAVHVGDRPDLDIEGAAAAGIAGFLIDRRGAADRREGALADLEGLPRIAGGA
jgi:putative hydrolase of the HAD superfamily